MKKDYFFETKLATGEYVAIVYSTASRRGTWNHISDLLGSLYKNGIDLAQNMIKRGKHWKDTFDFIYIMNDKNKYEQCFEDYRTIDLR